MTRDVKHKLDEKLVNVSLKKKQKLDEHSDDKSTRVVGNGQNELVKSQLREPNNKKKKKIITPGKKITVTPEEIRAQMEEINKSNTLSKRASKRLRKLKKLEKAVLDAGLISAETDQKSKDGSSMKTNEVVDEIGLHDIKEEELEKNMDTIKLQTDSTLPPEEIINENYVLFVNNLAFPIDKVTLKKHFEEAGKVYSIRTPVKKMPNNNKVFAYVEMTNEDDYKKALLLHNTQFEDRTINVEKSNKRRTEVSIKPAKLSTRVKIMNFEKTLLKNQLGCKKGPNKRKQKKPIQLFT